MLLPEDIMDYCQAAEDEEMLDWDETELPLLEDLVDEENEFEAA